MSAEFIVICGKDGEILLGRATHFGIIPLVTFASIKELKRFSMGILGYCEYLEPKEIPIPSVFAKAFEKEDNDGI